MACSNCFNNCSEIVSDKCVKYTGATIAALGITTGDTLFSVEEKLTTFLTSALDGSGINITIASGNYCTVVSQYLGELDEVTSLDLFTALVKAACSIQTQIDAVNASLTALNANYTIGCLDGVTTSTDTHDIVQAIITKLCEIDTELTALALDVETNYVKIADLNDYIAAYIESTVGATRYSSRMVPYSILPYYGSLGVFDATGAGIDGTEWEDIYICNGLNGTPDLRGRAIVGAISGVPGGSLASAVDPSASALNPNYALGTTSGANSVILTETQMPVHDHTLTDPGHTHILAVNDNSSAGRLSGTNYLSNFGGSGGDTTYDLQNATAGDPDSGEVETTTTGITMAETGGGEAHNNIQPVLATYFIIYIPS